MTFKIQLECYCHCGVVLGPIPFPSLMPSNSGDDQHPSLFFDNSLLGLLWRHRLVLPKTAKKNNDGEVGLIVIEAQRRPGMG